MLRRVGPDVYRGSRLVGRWIHGSWHVVRNGEWDTATQEEERVLANITDERVLQERERLERLRYWEGRIRTIDNLGLIRSLLRTRT